MKYTSDCIPAGFQIHVETWENDGDNYQTNIISGLTENDMKFYVDLAQAFKGKHGNDFHKDADFVTLIADVVCKHPDISDDVKEKFTANAEFEVGENADNIRGEVYELLGNPDENYYERESVFVRAVDSIKVYYIQTPIYQVDISDPK